jgi:hypothetical protein
MPLSTIFDVFMSNSRSSAARPWDNCNAPHGLNPSRQKANPTTAIGLT